MNKQEIKTSLVEECKKILDGEVESLKKSIKDAQFEANQHKGAMASRYDTFKEEAQARRSGFEKQLFEKYKIVTLINGINPKNICKAVSLGAVVETSKTNYFIFSFVVSKPFIINGKKYLPISISSPVGQILEGHKKGDNIDFFGEDITILEIF